MRKKRGGRQLRRQDLSRVLAYSQGLLDRAGIRLDREEFESSALLVYWESLNSYPAYAGCCDWASYLEARLLELIEQMRGQRNRRICVESGLSLDQPWGGRGRQPAEFLGPPRGDFTNGVAFWDYLARLGDEKLQLARMYCRKETDAEILAHTNMDCRTLRRLKLELREDLERYLRI